MVFFTFFTLLSTLSVCVGRRWMRVSVRCGGDGGRSYRLVALFGQYLDVQAAPRNDAPNTKINVGEL